MAGASILTLLAICGVIAGVLAGQSRVFPFHLAAAGGGLLFGIALFWLLPEMAMSFGWPAGVALTFAACAAIALVDRMLIHTGGSPADGIMGPLLAATALHSFLDGWSIRAVPGGPIAGIGVPLGLALHKIPEGLSLGWIARRSLNRSWKAGALGAGIEGTTLLGAYVEPRVNQAAVTHLGESWTAVMLAIIAAGFLFLGIHALVPAWRKKSVVTVFLASLLLVWAIRH